LLPGEWIRGQESGGGGYGDALDRAPNRVLVDVVEGWVSAAHARDTYGVVLVKSGDDLGLALDLPATARLRRELAALR